jgi:hypothetical protein
VPFLSLERKPSLGERVAERLIPVAFLVVVVFIAVRVMGGGEGKALVPELMALGIGGVLAAGLIVSGRQVEAPDTQTLSRIPGWFRFGPVGGVGGAIGLFGFVTIALLRAPMFQPVAAVLLVIGGVGAVFLHRRRARTPIVLPTIR